jgi:transposase
MVLLWDGLTPHGAQETKKFVKSQRHWLSVRRFPAYAPELNPLEYLFSASKSKDLANLYTETIDDIDAFIKNSKRRFQRRPDILAGFLKKQLYFERTVNLINEIQ